MNEDDYVEFSIPVQAALVVDRIDLDDSDNDLIYTDIGAKDLAKYNNHSLNVARIILGRGRQSIVECFNRIVYDLRNAIQLEFGCAYVGLDKPTYEHANVSADGDVVLRGELDIHIQIEGVKSSTLKAKIEQVVAAAIERGADEECNIGYEVIF
jgi:hypothetical protein